ncbi:ankyrin repeat and MYND domain-containing protein 1 [Erpetoichthys calabaricus]|uniref:ankyrin repeat and MYND domain-containing protein 1 n=1 Tax=Erpetoichthys calabaricus TaxID=27687 RepID=UPI002234DD83|nr:ankyrin repeat and MYND domain-containing protein 1 [Erpetoichthys calabaricus]
MMIRTNLIVARGISPDPATHSEQVNMRVDHSYSGDLVDMKKHGMGVQEWADGSTYKGQFQNDMKHGFGVFTWPNGEIYKGEFYKDHRHGHGVYQWPGGSHFTGKFFLNRKEGYGILEYEDGTIFQGLYKSDERFGPGIMTYVDGQQDVGLWHRNLLVKLCSSMAGAFKLCDIPEYHASFDNRQNVKVADFDCEPEVEDVDIQKSIESDSDPFFYAFKELLIDDHFVLPPEIQRYSIDPDHLPMTQSVKNQLIQKFFGEENCQGSGKGSFIQMPSASTCHLLLVMHRHINRHRFEQEKLNWDIVPILNGNRDPFGPKGPIELNSEQLILASSSGNSQNVYKILSSGLAHPDVSDVNGHIALIGASVGCHQDVINLLLDSGADVNKMNNEGLSAFAACNVLYYPPQSFHEERTEEITEEDKTVQSQNISGNTEMNTETEDDEWLNASDIQEDVSMEKESLKSVSGVTFKPSLSVTEGIKKDKKTDDQGKQDQALDDAFNSAESLLSFTIDGSEQILQTQPFSHKKFVKSYRESLDNIQKLASKNSAGLQSTIKLLLSRGADPNISVVPVPALFIAVKAGDSKAVRHFLECGARTDLTLSKELKGLSSLHVAASLPGREAVEITELLLQAAADPDVMALDAEDLHEPDKNFSKEPPSGFSTKPRSSLGPPNEFYSLPDKKTVEGGRTPLHVVCQQAINFRNAKDVVRVLLKYKADHSLLWSGHSALSLAISTGNHLAVEELLSAGADPNLPLGDRVGSSLCAVSNINYGNNRKPQEKMALLKRLIEAGGNILMPITLGDRVPPMIGTAVDYGFYSFFQDARIAQTSYHALNPAERELFNSRKEQLQLMADLLRDAVIQKEKERIARDFEQGIHYLNPSPHFVYTKTGTVLKDLISKSMSSKAVGEEESTSKIDVDDKQNEVINSVLSENLSDVQSMKDAGSISLKGGESKTPSKPRVVIRKPLFKYCYQCGRSVGVYLLPCTRCREVFYCSKSCKFKAWTNLHKKECLRVTDLTQEVAVAHMRLRKNQDTEKIYENYSFN